MKFEVGDKVIISNDLEKLSKDVDLDIVDDMFEFAGKEDCFYDIMLVYMQPADGYFLDTNKKEKPIWERQEPKEMTLAEVEKELGYPVKIVGEQP